MRSTESAAVATMATTPAIVTSGLRPLQIELARVTLSASLDTSDFA